LLELLEVLGAHELIQEAFGAGETFDVDFGEFFESMVGFAGTVGACEKIDMLAKQIQFLLFGFIGDGFIGAEDPRIVKDSPTDHNAIKLRMFVKKCVGEVASENVTVDDDFYMGVDCISEFENRIDFLIMGGNLGKLGDGAKMDD